MKNTHDEMIACIQAHKEGKKLQYWDDINLCWCDVVRVPAFSFNNTKYRIKPTPTLRECGKSRNRWQGLRFMTNEQRATIAIKWLESNQRSLECFFDEDMGETLWFVDNVEKFRAYELNPLSAIESAMQQQQTQP